MLEKTIDKLLIYAEYHLYLDELDVVFKRNALLHFFNLNEPYQGSPIDEEPIIKMETPTELINMLKEDKPNISLFDIEKVMSILSLSPSSLYARFNEFYSESPEKACSFFYDQMIKNYYIKADDIKKNEYFTYEGNNNTLEITINLAKPEKDNKDIEKASKVQSSSYPKCSLCYENVGYYGEGNKPARSNIRVIPLQLNNEDWFMQYSPYSYYPEHAIIIKKEHSPMHIDKTTIKRMLDYLDVFPNYFIGSNSDLPIVGGSMLFHEHFQAGSHIMPLMLSRNRYSLLRKDASDVEISYLDFYNSCFLLKGKNPSSLIDMSELIIRIWEEYNDESVDIISSDEEGRHSTVTPIARKVSNTYYIYLILRNNRRNDEYPEGIFHAHKEYHNIKKEGIGLIEAMGLFILPGRLVKELNLIKEMLMSPNYTIRESILANPILEKHINFINQLIIKYQRHNTLERAEEIIKLEIGNVCENILRNTGVFKETIKGQSALMKFFKRLSLEVNEDE